MSWFSKLLKGISGGGGVTLSPTVTVGGGQSKITLSLGPVTLPISEGALNDPFLPLRQALTEAIMADWVAHNLALDQGSVRTMAERAAAAAGNWLRDRGLALVIKKEG